MTQRIVTSLGPVQLLVIGFDDAEFTGNIRSTFDSLSDSGIVRLIDAAIIRKHVGGDISLERQSDLSAREIAEVGAYVGALIGLGAEGEDGLAAGAVAGAEAFIDHGALGDDTVWYATDAIPEGSAAVVALIEHRWAIPLRSAVGDAGGALLADEWIHPEDLVAVGIAAVE